MKKLIILGITAAFLLTANGCKSKDPAILKVFVRSSSNQLISGAKVVVIGDQQSNPPTGSFVDTTFTNTSGFTSAFVVASASAYVFDSASYVFASTSCSTFTYCYALGLRLHLLRYLDIELL